VKARKLLACAGVSLAVIAGTATTGEAGTRRALFLAALHEEGITGTDKAATRLARSFCTAVDRDGVEDAMFGTLDAAADIDHVDYEELGFVLGAGVVAFCPRHTDAMNEFLEDYS
jgi:hypothetical protein